MPEGTTINLAELVSDLRLLKDKVSALEKTRDTLASALTRTVQQAIEKTGGKFEREMKLFDQYVAERTNSIGEAIDVRFGETITKMRAAIETLGATRDDLLAVAGKAQQSASAAAKDAAVAATFDAKLNLLDNGLKALAKLTEAIREEYVDAEEHKALKARLDALENAKQAAQKARR